LLHDAAVFLGHYVLGLAGLGATAGTVYRYGPDAAEWVQTRACFRAGWEASMTSSKAKPYVYMWERRVWATLGGVQACAQQLYNKNAPHPHVPESIKPRAISPLAHKQAWLHGVDLAGSGLAAVFMITALALYFVGGNGSAKRSMGLTLGSLLTFAGWVTATCQLEKHFKWLADLVRPCVSCNYDVECRSLLLCKQLH